MACITRQWYCGDEVGNRGASVGGLVESIVLRSSSMHTSWLEVSQMQSMQHSHHPTTTPSTSTTQVADLSERLQLGLGVCTRGSCRCQLGGVLGVQAPLEVGKQLQGPAGGWGRGGG